MPFFCLTKTFSVLCACVAFAAVIMTVEAAHATIYYVATTGNDRNPGTNAQPLRTIAEGVRSLSAGDTLYVKSGTYAESIRHWQVPIPNGTSWSNPITVAVNPGDTVTIKPLTDNAFFWIADGQSKYLIIKGFNVDGANRALHGFKFSGGTKYIRVIDCQIKYTKNTGILVTTSSTASSQINTYHEFINLDVHHNGSQILDHGFYIETSHNIVRNSKFHHNKGNGGKFFHGNYSNVSNNNIARNNIFYDNGTAGGWTFGLLISSGNGNAAYNNVAYGNFGGFGIAYRVTNTRLYNNITYANDYYGIYVGKDSTSGSRVENNTVYNNSTHGIFVGEGATTTTVKNNISFANASNLSLTNATNQNNLTSNPLFVNASGKDFHLQSTSLAIDKGKSISGISTDKDEKPRPKGAAFDIGAYEHQGSGSTGSTSGETTTTTSSFPPSVSSPAPGSTLTSSSVTFTGGHSSENAQHWVYVGSTSGGSNYYSGGVNGSHQFSVSGLPSSGTIYVRYLSRTSSTSAWQSKTHAYTMSVGSSSGGTTTTTSSFPPSVSSPAPGSTLTSSSVTFTGGHSSENAQHWVYVGSTSGGSNYYSGGVNGSHQFSVSGLPSSGTIYVRYLSRTSSTSAWQSKTHSYRMSR
ncbi:MAG: right-handed parallel beta-helix repeat-containing protein [Nitrospirales bacterium]